MMRILLLFLTAVLSLLYSGASGQRNMGPRIQHSGGAGALTLGYTPFDLQEFDAYLNSPLSVPSDRLTSFGAMGYAQLNDWIIGASGFGAVGTERQQQNATTRYTAGMGFIDLGRMVYVDYRYKVYPMVGLGLGTASLNFSRNEDLSASRFPEEPFHETQLAYSSALFRIAITGEWYIEGKSKADAARREASGYLLGLRLGYIGGPPANNKGWQYGGGSIEGGPDFRISGFQFSLLLGGGLYTY